MTVCQGLQANFWPSVCLRFNSLLIIILAEIVTLLSGWPILPMEFLLTRQSVCPSICGYISNVERHSLKQLTVVHFVLFIDVFIR
jgi:hypothetical protein